MDNLAAFTVGAAGSQLGRQMVFLRRREMEEFFGDG
jgi:hypothetical protein